MTTASPGGLGEIPDWLRGERARPTLPGMAGAAGGVVVLLGAFLLLDDVDVRDQRTFGLALAALVLLVGVCLMLLEPRGALRTAGVTLSAGAVLPLAVGVVNDPVEIDSRTDALLALVLAALVWLVLFAFGPGRGHGLYLGLALLAAWVGAVAQTVPESGLLRLDWLFGAEEGSSRVEVRPAPSIVVPEPSIPTFTVPSIPEPSFTVPRFPERSTTEPTSPPFPTFPEFREERPQPPEPQPAPQQEETSLGRVELAADSHGERSEDERPGEPPIAPSVVSILFGVAYLAAAAGLDGARLPRLAGAFVAAGVPALAFGVGYLGVRHGATAVAAAAVAGALLLLAVGVSGGRRFSAWFGVAVLAGGVVGLAGESFEDPGSGDAVAMLLVGAALVAAGWFAGGAALDGHDHTHLE